ncbi:MAG: hypothetical protein ACPGUV_06825 [Polyangiales bacterium]
MLPSDALRRLWQQALARMAGPDDASALAELCAAIEGVTVHLRHDGQSDVLWLDLSEAWLRGCSSRPELADLLMRLLQQRGETTARFAAPTTPPLSLPVAAAGALSQTGQALGLPASRRSAVETLSVALSDLVTTVLRVGLDDALAAAAVQDAFEAASTALMTAQAPLGPRLLARLHRALGQGQMQTALVLLAEISALCAHVSAPVQAPRAPEQRLQLQSWLGDACVSEPERLQDAVLLEVARERVASFGHACLHRRYWLRVRDAALFVEAGQAAGALSVGPIPRLLHVGLAQLLPAYALPRLQLLQYVVEAGPSAAHWQASDTAVVRDCSVILQAWDRAPAAEPVFLFAPHQVHWGEAGGVCEDSAGQRLRLVGALPGQCQALRRVWSEAPVRWLCVRVQLSDAGVELVPLSLLQGEGEHFRLWRAS